MVYRMLVLNKSRFIKVIAFIISCMVVQTLVSLILSNKEKVIKPFDRHAHQKRYMKKDNLAINMNQNQDANEQIGKPKVYGHWFNHQNSNKEGGKNEEGTPVNRSYDFIIVGGGIAGCVLARRLAEDPTKTVLLLEAGIDDKDHAYVAVPHMAMTVMKRKDIIWDYWTEPQEYLLSKRRVSFAQGKILGGSGSINGMGVTRGSPHDYEHWKEMGNIGWGYEDVLPYFIKSEKILSPEFANKKYRGSQGMFKVRKAYQLPMSENFVQGIKELGYNFTEDYNGEKSLGFGYNQMNVDEHGYRSSTSAGYLRPVMGVWDNLNVLTEALVTKVDVKDGVAVGVQYIKDMVEYKVKARTEVILSAGALNTPKLLMLSGIGPKDHLQEMGIPVVLDSPHVGNHLHDHLAVGDHYTTKHPNDKMFTFESLLEFLLARTGLWTTIGIQLLGYFRTKQQPAEDKFPYMETILTQHTPLIKPSIVDSVKYGNDVDQMDSVIQKLKSKEKQYATMAVEPVLLHPRMTGTVRLRSTDIQDPPIIKINYLENIDDVKDFTEAIRFAQKLFQSEAFKKYDPQQYAKQQPCHDKVFDSDDYWECYIRKNVVSLYHYTTTCTMAPGQKGVVDLELKVNGLNNLRIVDASVMPDVVSGHTMATTVMIAEKAADIIKHNYNMHSDT